MYSRGQFKDVLFYKADVEKNLERKYHPKSPGTLGMRFVTAHIR
jgi:hypothetical protein